MALYDEYFYTNLYHGIPHEQKKTIKDNITLLNEGSNLLNNVDDKLKKSVLETNIKNFKEVSTLYSTQINNEKKLLDENLKTIDDNIESYKKEIDNGIRFTDHYLSNDTNKISRTAIKKSLYNNRDVILETKNKTYKKK